jgi:peptidyl-prolyl cis-trans isomerase C
MYARAGEEIVMGKKCCWVLVFGMLIIGAGRVLAADEDPIVVKMGNEAIRQSELKSLIEEIRAQDNEKLNTVLERKQFLENIIDQKMMAAEARRLGLDQKPDVKLRIQHWVDIILAQAYYAQLKEGVALSPDELKVYYDDHPKAFEAPEKIHVKHIIVATKEAATKAMADLDTGRPFEVVAQEVNMDASKGRGGDIGWYPRGRLVPEFETAAFALQKGEVSDIVQTRFGFHIIKLEDRRANQVKPFEDVQEEVRLQAIQEIVERQRKENLARIRKEREVQVFPEALP